MMMMMVLPGKGTGLGGGFWVLSHHVVTLGKSVVTPRGSRACLISKLSPSSIVTNSPMVRPHRCPASLTHLPTAFLRGSSQRTGASCSGAAGFAVPISVCFRS